MHEGKNMRALTAVRFATAARTFGERSTSESEVTWILEHAYYVRTPTQWGIHSEQKGHTE